MSTSDYLDKTHFPWWFNHHPSNTLYVFTVERNSMPAMQADLRLPQWAGLRAAPVEQVATRLVDLMDSLGTWTSQDVHEAFVMLMLLALHDRALRTRLRTAPGGILTLTEEGRLQIGLLTRAGLKEAYGLLDADPAATKVTLLKEHMDA